MLELWKNVNPELPLIADKAVHVKVKRLTDSVKNLHQNKKVGPEKHRKLTGKLESLFDLCACQCQLPIVPCDDPRVQCKEDNCNVDHIMCECEGDKKVIIDTILYI